MECSSRRFGRVPHCRVRLLETLLMLFNSKVAVYHGISLLCILLRDTARRTQLTRTNGLEIAAVFWPKYEDKINNLLVQGHNSLDPSDYFECEPSMLDWDNKYSFIIHNSFRLGLIHGWIDNVRKQLAKET